MVSRVYTLGRLLLWILCCQSSSMTQEMEGRERSWRCCSSWCQKFLSPHSLRWGRPGTWLQLPSCRLINVSGCTLLGSHGYNPRLPWILILNSFHLNTKESVWHDFLSPRSWLWLISSHRHPQRHLRAFQKHYLFKKNLLFSPFSLAYKSESIRPHYTSMIFNVRSCMNREIHKPSWTQFSF